MAWGILFLAGLLEVGWAVGLKYTAGFSRLWPTVGTAVSLVGSMALLGVALRTLPLGTATLVSIHDGERFHQTIQLVRQRLQRAERLRRLYLRQRVDHLPPQRGRAPWPSNKRSWAKS